MNAQFFQKILKQIPTLDPVQKSLISQALNGDSNAILDKLSKEVIEHASCIHCQSKRIKKHGFANGRQRFYCNTCYKSFVCTRGSSYFYQHKPELWQGYLERMLERDTIRRCAKELHISVTTSFNWRHRYLRETQNTFEPILEGIIEADETFFRKSQKGEKHLNRPARKRGTKASTKGINHSDWVAVLTAMDRNHHEYDHVLKSISANEICDCLKSKIAQESILCTDGQPAYNKVCDEHHLHHVVLKDKKVKQGVFHIQNINSYHSGLKKWYLKMHGVASKYLPKYLGWYRMLAWHEYQVFSDEVTSYTQKLLQFKLLSVQQHKFET